MSTLLITIVVFGVLIWIHEFGHFVCAKRVGIRCFELSLGFGPKLAGIKVGETEYTVRLFPIGGFVRMAGTDPEKDDMDDEKGFNKKSVAARAAVVGAGPFMNFVLAVALFWIIFFKIGAGFPAMETATIGAVIPDYPAEKAGLMPGDVIVSVGGVPVRNWREMVRVIQRSGEAALTLEVARGSERLLVRVTPVRRPAPESGAMIGVLPPVAFRRLGFLESLYNGVYQTFQITLLMIQSIVLMIIGRMPAEVAGPIGVGQMIGQATKMGLAQLLSLTGALSANIGLINLLPVPALDGSRLAFLGLEKLRGRPIDPHRENFIHFVGFALLILLSIVVAYRDILRLNA